MCVHFWFFSAGIFTKNIKKTEGLQEFENFKKTAASEEFAQAAIKIQAVFRGHQTRKTMKAADKNAKVEEPEPTREELEAEFRADDKG